MMVLGRNGFVKPESYPIEENKFYFMGQSNSPHLVYITRLYPDKVYYVGMHGDTYIETFEKRAFFEHDVKTGMETAANYHDDLTVYLANQTVPDYKTVEQSRAEAAERQKNYVQPRYVDVKECAQLMRQDLKAKWPNVKFSVRIERFSMGNDTTIRWTDGPTEDQVSAVCNVYKAGWFDGMQDLYEYNKPVEVNGELVSYGAKYITYNRSYSLETLQNGINHTAKEWGFDPSIIEIVTGEYDTYLNGGNDRLDGSNRSPRERVLLYLRDLDLSPTEDPQPEPEESPESNGVTYGEYKGHATITLPMGERGFSFGVSKAQAILDHIEAIRQFVEDNS